MTLTGGGKILSSRRWIMTVSLIRYWYHFATLGLICEMALTTPNGFCLRCAVRLCLSRNRYDPLAMITEWFMWCATGSSNSGAWLWTYKRKNYVVFEKFYLSSRVGWGLLGRGWLGEGHSYEEDKAYRGNGCLSDVGACQTSLKSSLSPEAC